MSTARLPESGTERDGRGWLDIEAAARAQVTADLIALESTPLEFGAPIAWSDSIMGRTNGFTEVHRVGFPQIGRAFTSCGLMIQAPALWLPMSPALARTMRLCRVCKAEQEHIARRKSAA